MVKKAGKSITQETSAFKFTASKAFISCEKMFKKLIKTC